MVLLAMCGEIIERNGIGSVQLAAVNHQRFHWPSNASLAWDNEYFPREVSQRNDTTLKGWTMKKLIIGLACVSVAPFVFAQTTTTTTEQSTVTAPTTTTETTTTYTAGVVDTYTPGKTIVVKDERGGPVRFALGTAARIVDGAGKIVTAPLRSGEKVRVYYTGTGETRVVERVQVED
jgi:hypothetical protein